MGACGSSSTTSASVDASLIVGACRGQLSNGSALAGTSLDRSSSASVRRPSVALPWPARACSVTCPRASCTRLRVCRRLLGHLPRFLGGRPGYLASRLAVDRPTSAALSRAISPTGADGLFGCVICTTPSLIGAGRG